ncbi:phage tail tape measure protein [[Clostridium] symbiosum]|uniref:phage tail tape measure protein n=1 Tax=Clostridium symbiosum TaxID=1512 RepID=UPI003219C4B5
MSLESVFKLSLIMNMIDNLTGPMAGVQSSVGNSVSKLEGMNQTLGNITKTGAVMAGVGAQITDAALAPVQATFATRKAIGELSSLGVKDLQVIEEAARSFSDQWSGTTKADFISAAYDIKSGIASLSDDGVAEMTSLAALTGKATKSTAAEMTSLFATGYGIYKDYYNDLSDIEFGEMFSAGIAKSVQQFKTTGSGMAQSIQTLGGSATTANVPLEEQLSILGMLQATMGGAEAGTKYKAFLRSAVKGGEELGLKFTDTNNQLLSMPEILDKLRGKFGETMDAAEKVELQKAFGDTEAVALIDLMYNKVGDLQDNIVGMYDSLGSGVGVAREMASAIQETEPERFERLAQRIQNVEESIGNSLLPTINDLMGTGEQLLSKVATWIEDNQELVRVIMLVVLAIGGFLTVAGTTIAIVGGVGLVFTKTAGFIGGFARAISKIPDLLDTIHIMGMYAGDGIKKGFSVIKTAGSTAITGIKNVAVNIVSMAKTAAISGVTALKNMTLGLIGMAKQAITTAVTALPGLVAGVWSFTAALLANPITWIIIAIIALVAAILLLWQNWDFVTAWLRSAWDTCCNAVSAGIQRLQSGFQAFLGFFQGIGQGIAQGMGFIRQGFNNVITWIQGKFSWFGEAGKRLITTFVGGIKSMAMAPVNAVKNIFDKIKNLFPHSDAKEGPLSTLTLSGQRTMTTFADGVTLAQDAPAKAIEKGFQKVDGTLTREPAKKVKIGGESKQNSDEDEGSRSGSEKNVIIQKLLMQVDVKKIKDLQLLLSLLKEVEDYTNANGGEVDTDAQPEPV